MRNLWVIFLLAASAFAADTRLTVHVTAVDTGKGVERASVVVKFRHGLGVNTKKMLTTQWETKTNQDGNVKLPPMPHGEITVQVIANNFQTTGDVFQLTDAEQTIEIKLNRPQPQYSEDAQSKEVPKKK